MARTMRRAAVLFLAAAMGGDAVSSTMTIRGDHPITKVIALLQGLRETAEKEGKQEEQTYLKFTRYCQSTDKTLEKAIDENAENMLVLKEKIEADTQKKEALIEQISEVGNQISAIAADKDKSEKELQNQEKISEKVLKDLADTITAIDECITLLDTEGKKSASLVAEKVQRLLLSSSLKQEHTANVLSMISNDPRSVQAAGDHQAHKKTYHFKSDKVIDLLKGMKRGVEDQHTEAERDLTNAQSAAQLAGSNFDDMAEEAVMLKQEKEKQRDAAGTRITDNQAAFDSAEADHKADSDALKKLTLECNIKASEWKERSKTRADEQVAMKKAIEILGKATGVRTEKPENPVIPKPVLDFLQIDDPSASRALQLIRQEAKLHHSKALDQLADMIAARKEGPFDQVINSIQKMIFHLKHEQTEEDKHKNWCDAEIEKTRISIDTKDEKATKLKTEIEGIAAKIQKLKSDVSKAQTLVDSIVTQVAEAEEIRKIGKEENKAAIEDAKDAQTAVSNAVAVLTEFYKDSGSVAKEAHEAFVQKNRGSAPVEVTPPPTTWEEDYTSVSDPSKQPDGILKVLEGILTSFSTMEADTRAQERSDQQLFEENMKEFSIEKAKREQEISMKESEQNRLKIKKQSVEKMHKGVEKELYATRQYDKDLSPACRDGDGESTYEDRKRARDDEINGLKEAQTILQDVGKKDDKDAPPDFSQLRGTVIRRHIAA